MTPACLCQDGNFWNKLIATHPVGEGSTWGIGRRNCRKRGGLTLQLHFSCFAEWKYEWTRHRGALRKTTEIAEENYIHAWTYFAPMGMPCFGVFVTCFFIAQCLLACSIAFCRSSQQNLGSLFVLFNLLALGVFSAASNELDVDGRHTPFLYELSHFFLAPRCLLHRWVDLSVYSCWQTCLLIPCDSRLQLVTGVCVKLQCIRILAF